MDLFPNNGLGSTANKEIFTGSGVTEENALSTTYSGEPEFTNLEEEVINMLVEGNEAEYVANHFYLSVDEVEKIQASYENKTRLFR